MAKGFVYFGGYGREIKIGKSIKPKARIDHINGANPNDVALYVVVASSNMHDLEQRMHQHFKYCRKPKKREWYALTPELQFVIMGLSKLVYATEFDLGVIFGEYKAYQNPIADNPTLYRRSKSMELAQEDLWAKDYAIRSLGMHNYPTFQERYAEAKAMIDELLPGELPMFVRKGSEPLTMAVALIEETLPPPTNVAATETEAA